MAPPSLRSGLAASPSPPPCATLSPPPCATLSLSLSSAGSPSDPALPRPIATALPVADGGAPRPPAVLLLPALVSCAPPSMPLRGCRSVRALAAGSRPGAGAPAPRPWSGWGPRPFPSSPLGPWPRPRRPTAAGLRYAWESGVGLWPPFFFGYRLRQRFSENIHFCGVPYLLGNPTHKNEYFRKTE